MKRMNIKTKRIMIISVLLIVCIILIGAIHVTTNPKSTNNDILIVENATNDPIVDAIKVPKEDTETVDVPEIKTETVAKVDNKLDEEIIDEPLPTEPEKPKNTLPEKKPQPKDNVEDMTKEPEYNKEEVTYIPEEIEEPKTTSDSYNNDSEENNLVPDSQNPFLQDNIPNNGDDGEIQGSDLGDDKWGTGDKF